MTRNVFNGSVSQVTNIDGNVTAGSVNGVGLTANFDSLFGSSGKDRTVSVRLPEAYAANLRRLADHERKGMGEYIRAALKLHEVLGPGIETPYDPNRDLRVLMMNDRELHQRLMDIYRL